MEEFCKRAKTQCRLSNRFWSSRQQIPFPWQIHPQFTGLRGFSNLSCQKLHTKKGWYPSIRQLLGTAPQSALVVLAEKQYPNFSIQIYHWNENICKTKIITATLAKIWKVYFLKQIGSIVSVFGMLFNNIQHEFYKCYTILSNNFISKNLS